MSKVEFVGSFPGALPVLGLPEIAFAGRSNVGKSSALNVLARHRGLARVSRTPGRTQAINLFRLDDRLVFADLPGYGFADVPDEVREAWKPMIERYLGGRDELKLVVVLIDARRDAGDLDGQMLYSLTEARIPGLVVATKCDKLGKQQLARQLATLRRDYRLPADQPIAFSSTDGTGRDEVWARIDAAISPPGSDPAG